MSEDRINDTALRIVVTPSQSSYFAGEPLSVTITITNTRSPQAQVVPPRSTHKRSAHSVSSARLARPPTSPGLPKSPSNAATPRPYAPPKSSAPPTRKGLIGVALPENAPPSESVAGRRVSAKSLSIDIPLHELPNSLPDDKMSALRAISRTGGAPLLLPLVLEINSSMFRREKLTARVLTSSPHILYTRAPKSPACSESVNHRRSSSNPAECFGLLFRAHARPDCREHVPHPAHTSISLARLHTSPLHFSPQHRQSPTRLPSLSDTPGCTPPSAGSLGEWPPHFSEALSERRHGNGPVCVRTSHRLTFSTSPAITCAYSSARCATAAQARSARRRKYGHRRRVPSTFPRP